MSFFGNSAINFVKNGFGELAVTANSDSAAALFMFLEKFSFSSALSVVAVLMIVIFFVTSADSAAIVMNMLCLNGRDDTPV